MMYSLTVLDVLVESGFYLASFLVTAFTVQRKATTWQLQS